MRGTARKVPAVVAICSAGELLERRLRCALLLTQRVWVAEHRGLRQWTPGTEAHAFIDPPHGKTRWQWCLLIARASYDITIERDRVYVFGFDSSSWISSIAVLGRQVVTVHAGEGEVAELARLEDRARAEAQTTIW